MAALRKRLTRELRECMQEPSPYFRVWPVDETFLVWEGTIHNIPTAQHHGKKYSLTITCSENHPFKPPTVRFNSKVKCENILRNGDVCMDILYTTWSPAITINKLMLSVTSLLTDSPVTGLDNKEVNTYLQENRLNRIEKYYEKRSALLSNEPRTVNDFMATVEEMDKLDRESREMRLLMQDYCLDRMRNRIPENVIVTHAQAQAEAQPRVQAEAQLQPPQKPEQKRKRRTELEMLAL
jgi:ubiquitin-conjugating enzyme E2 D